MQLILSQFRVLVANCIHDEADPQQFLSRFHNFARQNDVIRELESREMFQVLIEIGFEMDNLAFPFAYLDVLCEIGVFDRMSYVLNLTTVNELEHHAERIKDVVQKVRLLLTFVSCNAECSNSRLELCFVYISVVKWLVDLICNSMERRVSRYVILVKECVSALEYICNDPFARCIMLFICKDDNEALNDPLDRITETEKVVSSFDRDEINDECLRAFHNLPYLLDLLTVPPRFPVHYQTQYRFGANQCKPALLTASAIFALFRPTQTPNEMASCYVAVGHVLGYTNTDIVGDCVRGALLTQIKSANHAERQPLADTFVYLQLPKLLKLFVTQHAFSNQDLLAGLKTTANSVVLFQGLDFHQHDNTFTNLLQVLQDHAVLNEDELTELMNLRVNALEEAASAELSAQFVSTTSTSIEEDAESKFRAFQAGITVAKQLIDALESDELFASLADELGQEGELGLLDTTLAVICAEGKLYSFLNKIAELNHSDLTEQPSPPTDSSSSASVDEHRFDLTHLLLTRAHIIFPDLDPDDLAGGLPDLFIYTWSQSLLNAYDNQQRITTNERTRAFVAEHFDNMCRGLNPWPPNQKQKQLLETVPAVAETLCNSTDDPVQQHENVMGLLEAYDECASFLPTLAQWLDAVKPETSTHLAATIIECSKKKLDLEKKNKPNRYKRWLLATQIANPILQRAQRGSQIDATAYPILVICARRKIRELDPYEVPDVRVVKMVFFYAAQDGWIPPHCLAYIHHLNRRGLQLDWIKCWLQQMCKRDCQDELEADAELCIAAALLQPSSSLSALARVLVEADNNFSAFTAFNYVPFYNQNFVVARMMVRLLSLILWAAPLAAAHHQRAVDRRRMRRKRRLAARSIPSPANADEPPQAAEQVVRTIIRKFDETLLPKQNSHRSTYAVLFLQEILKNVGNEYQAKLLELIPTTMISNALHIEPSTVDITSLLEAFPMDNENNRTFDLHVVCLLRQLEKI